MSGFLATIALAAAASCNNVPDDAVTIGSEFMLDQAQGVEIGMTASELNERRPGVIRDSYSVNEYFNGQSSNTYWFAEPPDTGAVMAVPRGGTSRVRAITMDITVRDSAVDSLSSAIAAQWTGIAGPPAVDTVHTIIRQSVPAGTRRRTRIWNTPELRMILAYDVEPSPRILVRATVMDARVPIAALFPHTSPIDSRWPVMSDIVDYGLYIAGARVADHAPVAVDVRSFRRHFPAIVNGIYALSTQLRRRVVDATQAEAINCSEGEGGCAVVDDGLFIRLDSLRTGPQVAVHVTYMFTDRRPSGTVATCAVQARLDMASEMQEWQAGRGAQLLRRC